MSRKRRPPPIAPPPPDGNDPNPSGHVNLRGRFDTRMANNRRVRFNGVVRGTPLFNGILPVFHTIGPAVHEAVKGLFFRHPFLIHASPQQVAIEVAVQFIGAAELARLGGTTIPRMRAMLTQIVFLMPLYQLSLAISRMKQHDRDLENNPRTRTAIREWRERHAAGRDTGNQTVTRMQTMWRNMAMTASSAIRTANGYRAAHPAALGSAPVLKLCVDRENDDCLELTRGNIMDQFPDVR